MAAFTKFEDIYAWQQGRELVLDVYRLSWSTGLGRDFGLKDQIQRAAVSVCSNIAEGFERRGNREFVSFLWIAKGSTAEVSSQLYHLKDLGMIDQAAFDEIYGKCKLISASIYKLIQSITESDPTLSRTHL